MKSVLLVSAGGFQGLGMLQALVRLPSVRPIVADIHADNVTRYLCADYCVIPPLADAPQFAAALFAIVRREHVEALIPSTAHELRTIAALRPLLEAEGVRVAVPTVELTGQLLDKHETALLLAAHGVPVQDEIDPRHHDFSGAPLFGRPLAGWGGRGTLVLRTVAERDTAHDRGELDGRTWSTWIASFDEFSADFAVDPRGNLSPVVLRKRLRTSGGYAVISETSFEPRIDRLARSVASLIAANGGRGFFNVQVIRPLDGRPPMVSDVNPRFGTSFGHCLAEGINLAAFYLGIEQPDVLPQRRPSKTVRYLHDVAIQAFPERPQGVVFDLDDTLIDHKEWTARKALQAYESVAAAWCGREDFLLEALGLIDEGERRHLIDRLCERLAWPRMRHSTFLAAFREARVDTPVHPDVAACLRDLRAAGLKIAVLTDNPPATQRQKLEGAIGLDGFDAVVFARETGAEKPDSRGFAAVAQELSLPASSLCMVGDNLFRDCLGALRAGYGSAILLRRSGAFLQPHPGFAKLTGMDHDTRLTYASDLIIAREILLSP